jgi:HAD superfamily hydrolase (TIGR01450 family)
VNSRTYLIDVEGVLVRDKSYRPLPGAVAWLNGLRDRGIDWRLVSNSTTQRPTDQVAALRAAGFAVERADLVGALSVGVAWLRSHQVQRIGWLGTRDLRGWLEGQGFTLVGSTSEDCDVVVLGVAPDQRINDLDRALAWLQAGSRLLCLHRNRFWLDAHGQARLGPGAWAAALQAAVPEAEVFTAGKPEPAIYRQALDSLGADPAEALFISDDPFTDLAGARRLGRKTVLVMSGKYTDRGVLDALPPEQHPDLVLDRADQLTENPRT